MRFSYDMHEGWTPQEEQAEAKILDLVKEFKNDNYNISVHDYF